MTEEILAQPEVEDPAFPLEGMETEDSTDSPTVEEKETDDDQTPSSEEDKKEDSVKEVISDIISRKNKYEQNS